MCSQDGGPSPARTGIATNPDEFSMHNLSFEQNEPIYKGLRGKHCRV